MKKQQIKLVGVCAVALMAITAVTPVVAHAEEGVDANTTSIAPFSATQPEVIVTDNALLSSVNVPVSVINDVESNSGDTLRTQISALTNSANVTDEDVNPAGTNYAALFDEIFNKALSKPGKVYNNIGLTLNYAAGDVPGTDAPASMVYNGKALDKIIVTSSGYEGVNYIFETGQSFTLTFTGVTASGERVPVASVKINVVADAVAPAYKATAQAITAAIGENYAISQGVYVTGPKGNELTYVGEEIIDPTTGNLVGAGTPVDGVVTNAAGTASLDTNKGILTLNPNNPSLKKVLKPGTWYYIVDDSRDPQTGAQVAFTAAVNEESNPYVETDVLPSGKQSSVYANPTIDEPFLQGLQIVIPKGDTSATPATTDFVFHTKRNITVQNPTDIVAENVFRAYNPNDGDHLFTTSQSEFNNVVTLGWADEGVAWVAQSNGAKGGYAVYRVYNPNTGEHFYTSSKAEYINLGNNGWKQEGVGFYSAAAKDNTAVYRAFNPNAKGPGSHMFTTSKTEYDNIVKAGWTGEGIAFYGLAQK